MVEQSWTKYYLTNSSLNYNDKEDLNVVLVVCVVVVVVMAFSQALPISSYRPYYRKKYFNPPLREDLNYPLRGFLPHRTPCCWHGYDVNGYSRNGRDVSGQMLDVSSTSIM